MDRYELEIRTGQIGKLVSRGEYRTALGLADSVDWHKVKNAGLLSLASQVYEKNGSYRDAIDLLEMARGRTSVGRHYLYRLTELSLLDGDVKQAEAYYKDFCRENAGDPRHYILRYLILRKKSAPLKQQIRALESYMEADLDEKWMYELAERYSEDGEVESCIEVCDRLVLMFGMGTYVDQALELKQRYAQLSQPQLSLVADRDKYAKYIPVHETTHSADVEEEAETVPITVEEEGSGESLTEHVPAPEKITEASDAEMREAAQKPENALPVVAADRSLAQKTIKRHLMIVARDADEGLEIAKAQLKGISVETRIKNPVAKISGPALNNKGITANEEKLRGCDLIITEAGALSLKLLMELETLMDRDVRGIRVILVDVPAGIKKLCEEKPVFKELFETIWINGPEPEKKEQAKEEKIKEEIKEEETKEETAREQAEKPETPAAKADPEQNVLRLAPAVDKEPAARRQPVAQKLQEPKRAQKPEELELEDFVVEACEYARSIDCFLEKGVREAIYICAQVLEESGTPLTKDSAGRLIDEAADRAEEESKKLFTPKYNRQGDLILREKHFI